MFRLQKCFRNISFLLQKRYITKKHEEKLQKHEIFSTVRTNEASLLTPRMPLSLVAIASNRYPANINSVGFAEAIALRCNKSHNRTARHLSMVDASSATLLWEPLPSSVPSAAISNKDSGSEVEIRWHLLCWTLCCGQQHGAR